MRSNKKRSYIVRYIIILFVSILALFPIYWMVTMAFKPYIEWTTATGEIHWLPHQPTLDNFKQILFGQTTRFFTEIPSAGIRPILNSIIASLGGTAIAMVVGTLAAYSISRYKAGGKLPFFLLQLRMFPPMAIIVPIMIMWSVLGMIDTWWGLMLVYGVVTLPFSVWLCKTTFDEIPRELNEAAVVDGSSNWRAFYKVVLPLAKGSLASTALFIFILNWSDFILALILTTRNMNTIPVYLSKLVSGMAGQLHGPKAALGLIAAIPPVIFGILIQRYLVRGLTFGAVKE